MRIHYRSAKARTPTEEQGIPVQYAAGRRGGFRLRWYLLLALVISPVLILLWLTSRQWLLVTAPGLLTTHPVDMIAPEQGRVAELLVHEGQRVKAGQKLLRLSNRALEYEIQELEGQLLQMEHSNRQAEMEALLERSIEQTEALSQRIKTLLERIEGYQGRVVPAMDLASLLQSYNASLQMTEAARLQLQEKQQSYLLYGPLAQAKRSMRQQLAVLHARQHNLDIRAPHDGLVSDLGIQPGAWVEQGQSLLFLSGGQPTEVAAYIEPRHLDYSRVGQRAWVSLPNGARRAARVARPAELAARTPASLKGPFDGEKPALRLTLKFDQPLTGHLPEGLPVQVRFSQIDNLLSPSPTEPPDGSEAVENAPSQLPTER